MTDDSTTSGAHDASATASDGDGPQHIVLEPKVLAAHVDGWLSVKYPSPIVRVDGDEVQVLAGRPLTIAREAAFDAGVDPSLIQPLDLSGLAWHGVPEAGLRLWREPAGEEQVTVCLAGDPGFQVITSREDWDLIRLVDGATGWVGQQPWASAQPPEPAGADAVDRLQLVATAETFLETPYEWGGTTVDGVDCSGLVQRSAWMACSAWLPRHSTALLRIGERIARDDVQRGDVLVLRRKPEHRTPGMRGFSHVAIMTDTDTTVHASPLHRKVVHESLTDLLERYVLLSARRIGGGQA